MRNQFSIKKFYFLVLFALISVGQMFAAGGGGSTYYAKVTARATGAGIVYAESNGQNGAEGSESTAIGTTERSGENVAFTFTATPNDNYDFKGWAETNNVNAKTISGDKKYTRNYAAATSDGADNAKSYNIYAIFAEKPLFYFGGVAIVTPSGAGTATVNPETTSARGEKWNSTSATTNAITFSASPKLDYEFLGWSNAENGEIVSSNNPYKPTITSTSTNNGVPTKTTLYARFQARSYPTNITATPTSITLGVGDSSTPISATLIPAGTYRNIGFESANTSIATVDANGVVTGKAIGSTTITVKALKSDGTTVITTTTVPVTVMGKCATPSITIDASGKVTITCATDGATIYYTTDGSNPTTSLTPYGGAFTVTEGTVVKAIAVKDGYKNSAIATQSYTTSGPTGISGSVVTLNDLEDHNWAYYQQPSNLPSGYPTTYLSSPNPRNVKITYRGGGVSGASAVAISALEREEQNEMVYYKTLEKSVPGMSGDYPYTVISNPFSKRPKLNSTYYGFNGWKVISGGEYILEYDNDGKIGLDETIHFTNLDNNYTPNCMSAEIVFEATWTQATVKTGDSAPSFTNGTYETNFWVLTGNPNDAITVPTNCTMTARYPDGSVSWNGNFTRAITAGGNNAKVEFVNMNSTENVSAANYTFTMGRGIVNSGNGGELRGCTNSNADCIQTVKVESGKYASLRHFTAGLSNARRCDQLMILGCDYDRAKIDNSKLQITGSMYLAYSTTISRASGVLFARSNIKSGTFQKTITGTYSGTAAQSYYFGCYGSSNRSAGHRYMLVEGGDIRGLCGGTDHTTSQQAGDPAFTLRIRGSENNPIINGIIYGAAENADCRGRRTMVLTGGTVKGWIAGGANGTESSGGTMTGATFVYVGGKANVNSSGSQTVINRAVGGNVFAAGCGYGTNSSSGQVTQGTNVVVADDAYVERGVYGGGSYGYTTNTSNIYITGGRIGGVAGGVNGTSYSANIPGGVYGGACQNQGGTVNIYMTGGEVNGGLYGGSNNSGTISNNVTMKINGGQVGTSAKSANIHGGGYGKDTKVDGNVTLILGSNTTDPGVTVNGDVYGGSALGVVNNASTDKTEVTLNCGTINGSLYGGGLGDATNAATVNGKVTVTTNGGRVTGAVYGCNNVNGAPANTVTVNINNTATPLAGQEFALNAVYGGGNKANYIYNVGPVVNVYAGYVANIFGGGNEATVAKTDVNIFGGHLLGNVYGGGNKANITTEGTDVDVTGGRIYNVFGGNNESGNITGEVHVDISDVTTLTAYGRTDIDYVYGGGNLASYTVSTASQNFPAVNMNAGLVRYAIYGGGLGTTAIVKGNPQVKMTGGSVGRVTTTEGVTTITGDIFGGGNAAAVEGNTSVVITNGEVKHNVYGGGNQANVTGKTNVVIGK